jgi:ribonuclease J
MNCLAVETEGRILIIDCGVMFGNDDAGIELVHPGFDYLAARKSDIEGVVLTHGHEDHLSGLPFLLREIDVPIYAGSYAVRLLKSKTEESSFNLNPMTRECRPGEALNLGPFRVTPFPMPHSIVQNTGLLVEMKNGRLLHTGDFKLGIHSEGNGQVALDTLRRAAEGGVDLMLCDSTGAEESEFAGAESTVFSAMEKLFQEAQHRIFAAVFSSNIRRIESILTVSKKYGRKVALCGRSVQTHVRCALASSGINAPTDILIPLEEAPEIPRDQLTVLISGTQGEGRSALSRTASGNHHVLFAEEGDLVILSSRFIPGNELAISRMIDRLLQQGARVIHRGVMPSIHVSGHGSREEIRRAVEAVSPRCFLPIHGTMRHLHASLDIARKAGCDRAAIAKDGDTVHISETGIAVEPGVPIRRVFVDRGGALSEAAVKERRVLGTSGLISVALAQNGNRDLEGSIEVASKGVVSAELTSWLRKMVEDKVREIYLGFRDAEADGKSDNRAEAVRIGLRKLLMKQLNREPLIVVSILSVP